MPVILKLLRIRKIYSFFEKVIKSGTRYRTSHSSHALKYGDFWLRRIKSGDNWNNMTGSGCKIIDDLIGEYSGITLLYGPAGTGKTTLAKLAAIEYSKIGRVLFLDTENGFNMERVRQLASKPNDITKNVVVLKAKNLFQQHQAIRQMASVKNLKLIIVDTIGMHYRLYVKKDYKKANAILKKQMEILKDISKTIPVIVCTQVYSDMKSGLAKPTGGKIVTNRSDTIIRLDKGPRRMIFEKPLVRDALFEIKENGIFMV